MVQVDTTRQEVKHNPHNNLSGFDKGPVGTLTFRKDMITCKGSVSEEKSF